jgi:hypothetical protein
LLAAMRAFLSISREESWLAMAVMRGGGGDEAMAADTQQLYSRCGYRAARERQIGSLRSRAFLNGESAPARKAGPNCILAVNRAFGVSSGSSLQKSLYKQVGSGRVACGTSRRHAPGPVVLTLWPIRKGWHSR